MTSSGYSQQDQSRMRKAALLSVVGKILYGAQGLSIFVGIHLLGEAPVGVFLIAYNLMDMVLRCLVNGFGDSLVFFVARDQDDEKARLASIASGLREAFVLALVGAGALYGLIPWIYRSFWSSQPQSLVGLAQDLLICIPLAVACKLPAETTKASMDLRWSVLVNDALVPGLSLALVPAAYALGYEEKSLVIASILPYVLALPAALYGLSRQVRLLALAKALLISPPQTKLLSFAGVQSANVLLSFGMSRMDTLMLAAWVPPQKIALYGALAEICRSIRAAHTSLASVFGPLVSRYKSQSNLEGLKEALASTSMSIGALSIPLCLALLAFYPEIIVGWSSPWPDSPWVAWVLASSPLLGGFFGLAGYLLLMTGHPKLLLGNAIVMTLLNLALNLVLIPGLGMLGAATATASASLILSVVALWQIRRFEQICFPLSVHTLTWLASIAPLALVFSINLNPVRTIIYEQGLWIGLGYKLGALVVALVLYAAVLYSRPGPARSTMRGWLARLRNSDSSQQIP